jgi:hypothetical protein
VTVLRSCPAGRYHVLEDRTVAARRRLDPQGLQAQAGRRASASSDDADHLRLGSTHHQMAVNILIIFGGRVYFGATLTCPSPASCSTIGSGGRQRARLRTHHEELRLGDQKPSIKPASRAMAAIIDTI